MTPVFTCVGALAILDRLEEVDSETLAGWLSERQLPNGGLNGRPEKLEDVSGHLTPSSLSQQLCSGVPLMLHGLVGVNCVVEIRFVPPTDQKTHRILTSFASLIPGLLLLLGSINVIDPKQNDVDRRISP